jgi:hypothetical protein
VDVLARVMKDVRDLDQIIHSFNDELDKVCLKKSKDSIDSSRAQKGVAEMSPVLNDLRTRVRALLEK